MKKYLSVLVALCLFTGVFFNIIATATSNSAEELDITIINDGTAELATLYNGNPKEWVPSGTFRFALNGGHANSESYEYDGCEFGRLSVYDSESYANWTAVDYIQMYVFNNSTNDAYMQAYIKDNSGSYDGFESYCFSTEAVAYLSSDGEDFSRQADFIAEDMYVAATFAGKYGQLVIPAGFKGYVRIPATSQAFVNSKEWSWNDGKDFNNGFNCENLDFQFHFGANTKFTVDDISLVGDGVGANFPDYTFTMAEYLDGAVIQHSPYAKMPEHTQIIHTALDFESNVNFSSSPNDLNLSFERSGDYKSGGNSSLKITDGEDETGTSFISQVKPASIQRANISKAEYFEFWVKNTSSVDYTIVDLKINNILLDPTTTEVSRFDGTGYLKLKAFVIPAGYEGKFRLGINGNFVNVGSRSNRLDFSLKETTGTGGILYFDEFCFIAEYFPPVKVDMPADLEKTSVIEDFESGISNIISGINFIKVDFASSTDYCDEGSKSMKITTLSQAGGSEAVSQIQFKNSGEANALGAKYLQFWVKNTSNVEFGITWIKINGDEINHTAYEISIYKDGDWYLVNRYNKSEKVFAIPANYEGHIRIRIDGVGKGYKVKDSYIETFELALWEETRTANSVLYIDDFCTVGIKPPPYVKKEVIMPEGLEVVKVVLDAEDVNIKSIGSGINRIPVAFSQYEGYAGDGKYSIEIKNVGEGGGTPSISEFQPKNSYLNWTGGKYFEFKVTNPTAINYGISWIKIADKSYNLSNTEISYSENGKWYIAENNGYSNGILIYPGYEGYIRVKIADVSVEIEDYEVVNGFMFGVYQRDRTAGHAIYVDDFRVVGYMSEHTEEEDILQPFDEFPTEEVLEKIKKGRESITCYLRSNGTIPAEVISALKGKDIDLNVGVFDSFGITLYQIRLNGLDITEDEAYNVGAIIGDSADKGAALTLPVTLPKNKNKADIAVNVSSVYPAHSSLFFYKTKGESYTLYEYDRMTDLEGYVTLDASKEGEYIISDTMIGEFDNFIIPQTSDNTNSSVGVSLLLSFLSIISMFVIVKMRRLVV